MRKRLNHPAIDHAKTAGAIGDRQTAQHADQRAEDADAHRSADRLLVFPLAQKPRADDHVRIGGKQMIDQPAHFTGPVLPVAVDLHRYVIPVQRCIAITGLHRSADAQIERQTDHRRVRRNLPQRVIRRSIINDQDIKIRQRPLQSMREFADGLSFVESRDNQQAA